MFIINKMKVSASIVLYKNEADVLRASIESFLYSEPARKMSLYLIDNSPTDELKHLITSDNIIYIFNPSNPGFGAAHNIAIKRAIEAQNEYHFVINPDILVKLDTVKNMLEYMDANKDIGMLMPRVLNENGTIQNLPKLLPSPFSILMRKLKWPPIYYKSFIANYELRFVDENIAYNAPILSGCFTLLNLKSIKDIGMYDDQFFMYFEDWDLSRRMHSKYKTVYYPYVSVVHGYESGANKDSKLFRIFIKSAISYFNKWGWFFDRDRKSINRRTLQQFR